MAAAFVGGAALGALFGELLTDFKELARKTIYFGSTLGKFESMLNRLEPTIKEMVELNERLDRSLAKDFHDRLQEAQKIVRRCSKIRWWKYPVRCRYTDELLDLETSLEKFFLIDFQAQHACVSMKTLLVVNEMDRKFDRMGGFGNPIGIAGLCGAPEVRHFVAGYEESLGELKMQILKGGEQVVVLSGPGGCGKTTLAKMLCYEDEIKGMFKDNIFFVVASKASNLKVIVDKLFQHKGFSVPEFQTDQEAIYQLECMLNQNGSSPTLLVLDDVCEGMEMLIEDLATQILTIIIFLTSRFVFPRFKQYKSKLLRGKDAVDVFLHRAFPKDGKSCMPDDLVKKIVKGCGGFPLALKAVGASLRGTPEENWNRTCKQLSEGQSVFHSNAEVFNCLQTSIIALDQIDKECYLDLALFPEYQRIPVTALMDMWGELYNLYEDGEGYIFNLHELENRSLVDIGFTREDASVKNRYYNEHFVTQHDLLRELAIHLNGQEPIEQRKRLILDIRDNDFPRWWAEQREHPNHALLVSISTDEMFSSNWYDMQLPKVEVLLLNIQTKNYTLPPFMEKVNQLKVLIITHNGFISAKISNFPLLGNLSNLKRMRLEHVSLSSISTSILQLRNLQKLSLIMCEVAEAFRDCTIHVPDILPNLAEIVVDYCSDLVEIPAWLCDISSLTKISITNCHELVLVPELFGELINLQVLRLHGCTKLVGLPKSIGRLQKLFYLDLSDCIKVNNLPEQMGELGGLRELQLRGCRGLSELPSSVKDLKQLKEVICDEETAYLWEHYQVDLTKLEIKVVHEEDSLDWLHGVLTW